MEGFEDADVENVFVRPRYGHVGRSEYFAKVLRVERGISNP